jgi:hypothetical protein
MGHFPVSSDLGIDVSSLLLVKIDFLLFLEDLNLVNPNPLFVLLLESFHLALLGVVRLLENLLVGVFKSLVKFKLLFAHGSDQVQ